MASIRRKRLEEDESETKKARIASVPDSSELKGQPQVALNPADCDLDFKIEGDGFQGSALYEQGFAYCWSGARATVGITGGKYCFGCKIIYLQPVEMDDISLDQQHVCRLGISRGDDPVGCLGESEHSFGFGGTGKFSTAGKFSDYGERFGIGDTIVCAVNLETKPLASIGFFKNGKWLGTAKQFDAGPRGLGVLGSPFKKHQWESAVFPHVLLKNVVVQLQFSVEEGLAPLEGFKPWASALDDNNALRGPTFTNSSDCELVMMVGLPASGKTTWANKWMKNHPEKRYILLGTNQILDQMKIPGLLRKRNYGERFDRLMDRATGIFNILLSMASKTPRNYIIDQTNVYKNARRRKLKPFTYFHKIAVVVFPKPEELQRRSDERLKEMGKEVPAEAVNDMLANFIIPTSKDMPGSDEYFDEVIFVELDRADAQRCLAGMKRAQASSPHESFPSYPRISSVHSNVSNNSSSSRNQVGNPLGPNTTHLPATCFRQPSYPAYIEHMNSELGCPRSTSVALGENTNLYMPRSLTPSSSYKITMNDTRYHGPSNYSPLGFPGSDPYIIGRHHRGTGRDPRSELTPVESTDLIRPFPFAYGPPYGDQHPRPMYEFPPDRRLPYDRGHASSRPRYY